MLLVLEYIVNKEVNICGAGRGIRTPEGESQMIYSHPCLTASLSLQMLIYGATNGI